MRAVLLAAIASMGLVGCVGQLDQMPPSQPVGSGTNPNPTPNSMAKQMFDQNVYPIISSKTAASGCAMSGCHMVGNNPASTQFVAADATDGYGTATSYQALVGNFTTTTAGILTQVAAGHNGRTYTDAEKTAITNWLAQEVTERGQGTGSGGTTTESPGTATARLMNEWSACMNITDFNTANMATAWGQMQTNQGSRCESCHATGGYGMIVTQVAETVPNGPPGLFTTIATNKYYTIQYFSVDLTQPGVGPTGTGKMGKIIINKTSFEGVAKAQPPHTEHPTFNADTNQGMTALQQFYDLTMAKVTAGGCGATKLDPPAQ